MERFCKSKSLSSRHRWTGVIRVQLEAENSESLKSIGHKVCNENLNRNTDKSNSTEAKIKFVYLQKFISMDIRWEQRFLNYRKALSKLDKAVNIIDAANAPGKTAKSDDEVDVMKEGLIQRFEYTHELAWKVMKDYTEYQGATSISGSRDATREAFKMELIAQPEGWMDMLASRNATSHTYNSETAEEIFDKIMESYIFLFKAFEEKMESIRSGTQKDIFDQ